MAAFDSALPCPLPARADDDAEALQAFRKEPGDERAFTRARRILREAGDWRSMAKLLVEHAAAIAGEPDKLAKVAEHAIQAYELFAERVRDPEAAAHALARALLAQPENDRVYERLYASYQQLGWAAELATLLAWRMSWARKAQPSLLAGLHFAYAELQRASFFAISEAVEHYEQALAQDPMLTAASDQLIELHLRAGAWQRAVRLMEAELSQLEAHPSYAQDPAVAARISQLHVRLARIAFEQHQDLASSARHLQAAIKTTPQNLAALRAFGTLYLGSGKASDEGMAKASGIFLKAAQLARAAGDSNEALKLLRRTLSLRPDHYEAAQMLAELLAEQAHWMELDEHYQHMLTYLQGPPRVQVLLARAANLDQRLSRREEARVCYEEAGQYQTADGEAWAALERIYRASADWAALATLLEWKVEQLGAAVPTTSLLEAAKVFHHQLDDHERAAVFYFKVLEREPFQPEAFEGYKEHFRRKHAWQALRDLILYQIDQATAARNARQPSPLDSQDFAQEFIELAEICERRLGDVDGAVETWHRMSIAYPHDPQSREHMGRIQKRTRMWDNMVRVQEAELARSADPRKRLEIIKRLAQIYRDRQVHPQRAIELYSEMLHLAPGDLGAIRALTSLYDRAGDHHQVIELLKQQYEIAQNEAERVSLLRRMAEIWHHELHAYPEAMWACEEILALTGNDLEALHRLQLLAQETGDLELLIAALEREHKVTGKADGKAQILRRLARTAENRLNDRDRAAGYWSRLHDLEPDNLEVVDKVIAVYEGTGRFEELAELLGKAASSSKTPIIRQLDYLLRLGYLAQAGLGDPDLARSAYERVIKIRPDHRGALDALATLYRVEDDTEGLAEILGKQRELADSDEQAFALAWEQSQLLLHEVGEPTEAAEVLAEVARDLRPGDVQVNRALLDAYQAAGLREQLIAHAELMLLGTSDGQQRGHLHDLIIASWQALENKRAAMRATERRLREYPNDPHGYAQLAELQEELGDFELALRSLARKLELVVNDPDQQIATLRRMAEIADLGLADRNRALELLRRASGIDPTDPELRDHIEQFAEAHGTWKELLEIDELRINRLAEMGDVAGQLDICTEASRIAEEQLDDADRSFAWARRGYFIARQQQLDFDQGLRRLRKLAETYKLWTALLEVTERELERQTFSDEFELVERMIDAAEIAENKLDDPRRAVVYLQRALRERPDDDEVTRRIQTIAESHELWDALLDLAEHRLERADSSLGRFDAFCAISRIHERKLDDPRAAFRTLRRAWKDLLELDTGLADEALDMAINMAESHKLWRDLADHYASLARERASEPGNRIEAVEALAEAARIVNEHLEDPISAMRVLLRGVVLDQDGDVILPRLRELAARVDHDAIENNAHDGVRVGALIELRALSDRIAAASSNKAKITLLAERAEIREQRLEDGLGALAEWVRILTLDPFHADARDEAERIAERYDLWQQFMVIPAWELERAGAGGRQQELQLEIADLYEHKLARPEYAFRSRLEAWRREPSLPPRRGELGDPHRDLWRLAGVVAAYRGPALPKDPMLEPSIPQPEQRDRTLWARARLDPQHLAPPGGTDSAGAVVASYEDPHAEGTPEELTAVAPMDGVEEVSRVELVEDSIIEEISRVEMIPTAGDSVVELLPSDSQISEVTDDLLEEVDEIEELDDFEPADTMTAHIEEVSSAELESATVSGEIGKLSKPESDTGKSAKDFPTERFGRKTIPLPRPVALAQVPHDDHFDLARGLPPVPKLAGPILSPRPSVGSAWEELANAYAELPTANKEQKVEVQLACARLWEEGADKLDRAFACHERALLLIPERPESVASLEALAGRHEARARLLRAWEQLLNEAALPEHVVALNLRIAEFHERDGRLEQAEARYKAVLAVNPGHLGALRKLLSVYDELELRPQYVETYADLLNVERNTLGDDERITRSLRLAELYEEQPGRSDDALELLRFLVRDFPEQPEVHSRLRDLLLRRREWPQAIDAMRTANEELFDPDLRADNLARIAEVYQQKLDIPDRAIEAWNDYRTLRPEDERPLAELQQLYLDTSRWEKLLPILDARLDRLANAEIDDVARQAARVRLLVAKARALQEGLGDELAATKTLEQLAVDAPDDDEVALGLSRLYRRTDRFDEGVALLRGRIERLSASLSEQPGNARRVVDLSKTLARILHEEGKRHAAALELIRAALELDPDDRELLALRTKLARALNDLPLLIDGLERLGEPDGLLEAAELARKRLGDATRAEGTYRRVLDQARREQEQLGSKPNFDEVERDAWTVRLTSAIEGLVRLRIDAGDLAGATAFMDEQLAALRGDALRARLLTEIGRITYRTTGDVAAARARFDAALALVPDHAEARLGLGELLLDSGDLVEAERQLERAVDALGLVRDHVHLVEGLVLLARTLEASDRSGEAYRRLTTALRHDPDDLSIRLAVVRNRLGARRHRDVVTAVDQLDQRLDASAGGRELPLGGREAKLAAEIFAIGGECELESKQPDKAYERLQRALQLDPDNRRALALIIPWLQDRGEIIDAARYAARLAEALEDPHARGSAWVDAGMLYHEAAQMLEDGELADAGQSSGRELTESERRTRIAELEREAFECVRVGLVLVSDSPTPVLDPNQLEVAFRASATHDPALALRCLERLLLRDFDVEQRLELLLEGARTAMPPRLGAGVSDPQPAAQPDDNGPRPSLELALAYADRAIELAPLSSAAVLAKAEVLEAGGRAAELQPLVKSFLARLEQGDGDDKDVAARINLLTRLAAIQSEQAPAEAAGTLEEAARLSAKLGHRELSSFGVGTHKQLAALYERLASTDAAPDPAKVIDNHRGLLIHDPLHLPSLRALAAHHQQRGELQRALAIQHVIALLDPADEAAKQFIAEHRETQGGELEELDVAAITGELPTAAGVPESLMQLWESGQSLIAEHFDKLEFDAKARVSPVGEGALAQAWRDVLRRMGQTKVVLVADPTFDQREPIDPHPALAWAEPHCQLPPILLAGARARSAGDDDRSALEFALARGVYLTRPEVVMVAGQTRAGFAILTSAMLLAFHPRHAQRKQAARNVDDPVGKLGHELGRKLPIRVARQIGALLKDHEAEPFDSRAFRTWIRRAADRVGLLVCGDLRAALRVLAADAASGELLADENVAARIAQHPDLVALIGFAVSGAHADARRRLGFVVAGDSTPSERLPAPPIDVELGRRNAASDAESGVPRRRIRADTSRIRLAVAKDAATRESSAPMLAARRAESAPAVAVSAPAVAVPSSSAGVPEPRAPEPTPVATPIPVPIPAAEPDGFEELEALDEDVELETAAAEPSGRGERAHEQAPIDEPELEDGELFDDLDDVDLDLAGDLEELEMDDVDVEA